MIMLKIKLIFTSLQDRVNLYFIAASDLSGLVYHIFSDTFSSYILVMVYSRLFLSHSVAVPWT